MINPIKAIRAYMGVSTAFSEIQQEVTHMPKSGFFTSEFFVTVAATIAALWQTVRPLVPEPYAKYATIAEIGGAGVYTICRTALKVSADIKTAKMATTTITAPADATTTITTPA